MKIQTDKALQRRQFLQLGLAGASFVATGGLSTLSYGAESDAAFYRLGKVGPLQAPDANGIMLPAGFQSRIVARSGQSAVTSSAYRWHASPDGGACFGTDDGGWIYVSNAEENSGRGGVGALRFNANAELIDSYPICQNTSRNCAGGPTPWGTWLSCEEFAEGQVYECDPSGNKPAQLRAALGTFEHEAAAVDLANDHVYLTEDDPDGGFYRFTSTNGLPDLSEGKLEIATLVSRDGKRFIEWAEINDPEASIIPTRRQVPSYFAFNGGEGIGIQDGIVYFTTKGDNRVWRYDTDSQQLGILYDARTSDNPILTGVDNLVITPAGDVLVAEDGGNMQIVTITPDGDPLPLLQIVGQDDSEICGPAFDPSHQRMYFSSQNGVTGSGEDGITYEISRVG
jgi:secreted PhoX family phosphatase